jgi:antitoxin (DNA-binding transcriptional repressor) of toxin-antitoxin stability system
MIHVDVQQMQADLPTYLDAVARGETVVVCKDNQPVAELRPVAPAAPSKRPLGLGRGMGEVRPTFFDPLPPDELAAFNGEGE